MSHDHAQIAKQEWEKQERNVLKIYALGAAAHFKKIENLNKAFQLKDHSIRCIDEGTPNGIHMAGSGILLSEEKAVEALKKANADGVYSHEECGAAGLYAKANSLDPAKADEYGKEWAVKIAAKAGIPYKGHIGIGEMKRPSGLHIARVAYYDGTGKFDCSVDDNMPAGFVISRRFLEKDYALEEAKVSVSIALGGHGYGELITKDDPFLIIVIGDPSNPEFSVDKLKAELSGIEKVHAGRVMIDGFVAP